MSSSDAAHRTYLGPPTLPTAETDSTPNFCSVATSQCTINPDEVDGGKRKPLIIFVNPRSGGNKGVTLLRKFQWSLNPHQVFDLSKGGPEIGLQLYSQVPDLRVLACGGDGTVSWVLSSIDDLHMVPAPPVAVLPLGTGNDLARTLGWGPGYTSESIYRTLRNVECSEIVQIDRWKVECEPQTDIGATPLEEDDLSTHRPTSSMLPLKVFNNYFSIGADAATALEVHESREANPARFNSRVKNKMNYVRYGGKDILLRSWRDLSEYITLECDGSDFTPMIRNLKPHALLFLNIPRYSSGTLPWGTTPPSPGFVPPRIDDGLLEVIGLSSTTLALLQLGGHGDRICQCRAATVTTNRIIPVQMDGEPCRLLPSKIEIRHSHRAVVARKCEEQTVNIANTQRRGFQNRNTDPIDLLNCNNSQIEYVATAEKVPTLCHAG